MVCLLLILIIGVSHGSLDHIKGRKLLKIFQINNIITFYTSYVLLAVTIIILWVLLPTVVLIAFFIVASFHFGKEDTQFLIDNNSYFNQFLFFLKGSLVILAPLYFNFNNWCITWFFGSYKGKEAS